MRLINKNRRTCLIFLMLLFSNWNNINSQNSPVPFEVTSNLFDYTKVETLGLKYAPGTEKVSIFCPDQNSFKYNHGVVLFPFKGYLYAQWQSSSKDEDAADTKIVYSKSADGKYWSNPRDLVKAEEGTYNTSGGWWSDDNILISYINVWLTNSNTPKDEYVKYITSSDGSNWSEPKLLLDNTRNPIEGVFEQDPHLFPGGRIINAIHKRPGLVATPYYTNDSLGITGWTKGIMENLPFEEKTSRELEPSWFYRSDSAIVMLFRDQKSSFRKLASISYDKGKTWSQPVLTDMPDSRSKQSAGNLSDGTAFQINNPSGNKNRFPLVIVLSRDGKLFDKAFLLRSGGTDLQPQRYEGLYKRAGYSYPKSVIWKNYLYVSYATNKEDVELTRVPIESLIK